MSQSQATEQLTASADTAEQLALSSSKLHVTLLLTVTHNYKCDLISLSGLKSM